MIRRVLVSIALTASAVAGFYAIAPRSDDSPRSSQGAFANDAAVARARAEYQARSDSAIALDRALERALALEAVRTLRPSAAAVSFTADPRLNAAQRAEFARVAEAQFASYDAPVVPLRVVLGAMDQAGAGYRHLAVLPTKPGEPCVSVLLVEPTRVHVRPRGSDRFAGICGFYARHGLPGRGVLAWIDSGHTLPFSVDVVPRRLLRTPDQRNALPGSYVARVPATAACLAGRDEGCADAFAGGDWRATPRRVVLSQSSERVVHTSSFASLWTPASYIARLREHVGDDAFARIWASDESPPVAYEQVMGESFAVFARPLLLEEMLPHDPGPLRADVSLALSLALAALCAAWAIGRTRRERS